MEIYAKIIEDSISKDNKRITTMQIHFPKCLTAEFNTHRVFSRNFSSSRAIPVSKLTEIDSFYPLYYGENQSGMQAKKTEIENVSEAEKIWLDAIEYCKNASLKLSELGLHKQWSNRLNDWHTMSTGIVTSTEWNNFFMLRDHPDAQPEIQELAIKMKEAINSSIPKLLNYGEWHLPYVTKVERETIELSDLKKISAARCCRVSYLKQDGTNPSIEDDLKLFNRLAGAIPKHYSPLEHQATPCVSFLDGIYSGNFKGWVQFRRLDESTTYNKETL